MKKSRTKFLKVMLSFAMIGFISLTLMACSSSTTKEPLAKIKFNTLNKNKIPSVEIGKDGKVEMPKNPKWNNDYTFAGWYVDKDYSKEFKNDKLSKDTTVYAKWMNNDKIVRTNHLDLFEITEDISNPAEGWEWNNTSKTFTLSGFTMDSSKLDKDGSSIGIVFPRCPNSSEKEDDNHKHISECPTYTLVLTDGTVNTINIERAESEVYSSPLYCSSPTTIKTSGSETPGKLNITAAKAKGISIAFYTYGNLVIESGDITATAGVSLEDNSVGVGVYGGNITIKNGNITAIGKRSDAAARGENPSGSFGIQSNEVEIENGTVIATAGPAKTSLSSGILGTQGLRLKGGNITAEGKISAVASFMNLTENGSIVNSNPAIIKEFKEIDPNKNPLYTFVDGNNKIIKKTTITH